MGFDVPPESASLLFPFTTLKLRNLPFKYVVVVAQFYLLELLIHGRDLDLLWLPISAVMLVLIETLERNNKRILVTIVVANFAA